jgi:uncharacterized protein (DUF983 family)
VCGQEKLFCGWFSMHSRCPHCDANFEREPGFFLGSIYFNYGLTALICTVLYMSLMFNRHVEHWQLVTATLAIALLFPIWFFRYARSLWLGFDQYMDPRKGEAGTGRK